jgi:hypothetical protein
MEGIYMTFVNWKSRTALFVNTRGIRLPPATMVRPDTESDCFNSVLQTTSTTLTRD